METQKHHGRGLIFLPILKSIFIFVARHVNLSTDRQMDMMVIPIYPPPPQRLQLQRGGGMKISLIIRNACFEMYIYIKDLSYLVYIIHNMHTYMYKYRIICKIRYDCLMFYALYQLFWLSIIFHTIISSRIKQHIVTFF